MTMEVAPDVEETDARSSDTVIPEPARDAENTKRASAETLNVPPTVHVTVRGTEEGAGAATAIEAIGTAVAAEIVAASVRDSFMTISASV
jgi:hypothetical protein